MIKLKKEKYILIFQVFRYDILLKYADILLFLFPQPFLETVRIKTFWHRRFCTFPPLGHTEITMASRIQHEVFQLSCLCAIFPLTRDPYSVPSFGKYTRSSLIPMRDTDLKSVEISSPNQRRSSTLKLFIEEFNHTATSL
ncbi:hypothetical protein AA313_de0207430 [Arthrobotrys entomopaga]|nr:hypothetical protein AA313_de0207430 [Arthrobotrys entomopaga]